MSAKGTGRTGRTGQTGQTGAKARRLSAAGLERLAGRLWKQFYRLKKSGVLEVDPEVKALADRLYQLYADFSALKNGRELEAAEAAEVRALRQRRELEAVKYGGLVRWDRRALAIAAGGAGKEGV